MSELDYKAMQQELETLRKRVAQLKEENEELKEFARSKIDSATDPSAYWSSVADIEDLLADSEGE